ncbi:consortin isoform X2 [Hyaena hyaena]|uniref:consortin isoform X2 n=1 Tax=Hyaena hyaena TaxID=95912 RepID=UPI001921B146|nr:consortin isoform X2 [Hyaena hyaena]
MDDSETPTYDLQIEPQDGCHPGDGVSSTVTRLPSASDENENRLDGDGQEGLSPDTHVMGRPEASEQDSLNNNESCTPSCEVAVCENSVDTPYESPKDGQASVGRDKKIPGRRSSRTKRGTTKKIAQGLSSGDTTPLTHDSALSASAHAVSDEESVEVNANDPAEAPKLVLQYLFSLIQGEVEQVDSRALPLCLHQIAESYFQEEDYEKAMKFIQLERLYHEKLLANLSAIQEEWETKWKTVQPPTVPSLRNSEKGFNGEDFERLTKFCSTHQDPVLSKHKRAAIEKPLGRKCFTPLIVSEDPNESGATAKEPESESCPGGEPGRASPESGGCGHQMDRQAEPPSLLVAAGQDRAAELRAQPPGAAGSASEGAREGGSRLQPAQTDAGRGAARLAEPGATLPGESMPEPSTFPGPELTPPAPSSQGRYSQTQRKELRLPLKDASEAWPTDRLESSGLREPQQPDLTGSDGKSPRGPPGSERVPRERTEVPAGLLEPCMAPEGGGGEDDPVSTETEDYLHSFLQGCLKDSEDFLSCEDQEEDSDLLPDLSPEEASYSLQENLPSDESCLSLDDLAKRIQIAEVVPAEGLVSILKKRNDSVGHPAQMQQKPSKRRVRFQEIDDGLDQDEVGGGSCILLVLLCIATVFLSVGGTALYCTFGDMESPVCTDFADNMDFYYTKLVQGMAELKHWIYLS